MDIRFIAVIFLIAAIMEMIGKMMRKARERELEGEERPRSVDPLAQVFKEMDLLQDGEKSFDPVPKELESGDGGRSERVVEALPDKVGSRGEPAGPWALPGPASPEGSAGRAQAPPPPPGRRAEAPGWPPRAEPASHPARSPGSPARPLPAPASRELQAALPRERALRPVEVRSREFRPRGPREIVPRRRPEEGVAPAAPRAVADDPVPARIEAGLGDARTGEADRLSLGSVRGLRRLVVAREVLGAPLALRGKERFPDS